MGSEIDDYWKRFDVGEIAIHRSNNAQFGTRLQGGGFESAAFGQRFKDMTAPARELERLLVSDQLCHGGHPVLRWSAPNVAAEPDAAGNIKPRKKKSADRSDGIVAAVMALGCVPARRARRVRCIRIPG